MKQEQESMKLVPKVSLILETSLLPVALHSELDTMVAGDVEGDVGEQLVEEAVDHRHDDDARTAALRHQLRHLLLHQHLQRGWTKFVFHHLSS